MRRIKTEKMRELVLDVQRNPQVSSTTSPPPVPSRIPQNVPQYPGPTNQFGPAQAQNRYPSHGFAPANQPYPYKWS